MRCTRRKSRHRQGKARQPGELGSRGIATTEKGNLISRMPGPSGQPHDGHSTLAEQIEQATILMPGSQRRPDAPHRHTVDPAICGRSFTAGIKNLRVPGASSACRQAVWNR